MKAYRYNVDLNTGPGPYPFHEVFIGIQLFDGPVASTRYATRVPIWPQVTINLFKALDTYFDLNSITALMISYHPINPYDVFPITVEEVTMKSTVSSADEPNLYERQRFCGHNRLIPLVIAPPEAYLILEPAKNSRVRKYGCKLQDILGVVNLTEPIANIPSKIPSTMAPFIGHNPVESRYNGEIAEDIRTNILPVVKSLENLMKALRNSTSHILNQ